MLATLGAGIVFGFGFAYMLLGVAKFGSVQDHFVGGIFSTLQGGANHGHAHSPEGIDANAGPLIGDVAMHSPEEWTHQGDDAKAKEMAKKVRVLCWVMTTPENHQSKAKHIKATWGRRCNILLFMSTAEDKTLPAIKLSLQHEGRDVLWGKTKQSFQYVYDHFR